MTKFDAWSERSQISLPTPLFLLPSKCGETTEEENKKKNRIFQLSINVIHENVTWDFQPTLGLYTKVKMPLKRWRAWNCIIIIIIIMGVREWARERSKHPNAQLPQLNNDHQNLASKRPNMKTMVRILKCVRTRVSIEVYKLSEDWSFPKLALMS